MTNTRSAFRTLAVAALAVAALPYAGLAQQKPVTVSVFKTPTCGCCSKWVDHMKAHGFDLKVQNVDDISAIKTKLGVAPELGSCHTAQVEGYVIEGHVPATSVQRLLKERPKVTGLTVPGMPVGSPGMEIPSGQTERYDVLTFARDGQTKVFEKR